MTANTAQRVDVERLRTLLDESCCTGPWRFNEATQTVVSCQSHPLARITEAGHRLTYGGKTGREGELIAEAITALPALLQQVAELQAKTACTMGVGAGAGQLFVHGDFDSIKAAQALAAKLAEQAAEIERAAVLAEGREATIRMMRRELEAAERARDEACGLLRLVLNCHPSDRRSLQDRIAAFLAANGGSNA